MDPRRLYIRSPQTGKQYRAARVLGAALDILGRWTREYLSTERNRRDARSALISVVSFLVSLYIASHGMIHSSRLIDRTGRAIAVRFMPAPSSAVADIAKSRIVKEQPRTIVKDRKAAPPSRPAGPSRSAPHQAPRMAAAGIGTRPDYFGGRAILPPANKDLPLSRDLPEKWSDRPKPSAHSSEQSIYDPGQVEMPVPKIGGTVPAAEKTHVVSFDVPSSQAGSRGSKGADYISLSSADLPSSIGRPDGTELSTRRSIIRSPLPAVPDWFERKGLDSVVTLRVTVSAAGKVESAEVEKTSGFKEIDADARDAVLQWVFEPTGFREAIVIKLNYKLR